ncbi:Pentatricopeptide repeat - like 10, partial [Theobroma cacao]
VHQVELLLIVPVSHYKRRLKMQTRTSNDQVPHKEEKMRKGLKRSLLVLNCALLAFGNVGGPLIMKLYFLKGGKGVWTSSCLETAGWPFMVMPLTFSYLYRRRKEGPATELFFIKPPLFLVSAVVGLLTGVDDFLYAYGVARLPVSTSALIISTQLAFTAAFAFLLVKQKFTSFTINSVFLLTVGAVVLALHTSSDRPANESNRQYYLGFFMTLAASTLYGFVLPAIELTYKKAKQTITYSLVMEMQMVMSFSATVFCTIGMLFHKEVEFFFMGAVGVIFSGSSLLSGIIIAALLPVTESLAVLFFHEKFQVEKAISVVLSLWGSLSYFYGELQKNKKNQASERAMAYNCSLSRLLSSGAASTEYVDEYLNNLETDDLKSRIFWLRLPKRSATTVIEKWVGEGNRVSISDLRQISKELRKSQRFKHALEISEWMVTHEEYKLSDSDYAIRIDLMTKVFGIDAAERYFEDLPPTAKTSETYTALLHCYAAAKLTEKAEELFERIKGLALSFSALMYNEIMTLYMSIGQVEKVSLVVEELKRHKVAPDIFTYNLWISSCAAALNIDQVKRILDEMRCDSACNDGWKGITQREWITYDFLVMLYAGLGNKDKIDQIWKSLRMTKQKMTSRNYICISSSYLILGHSKEVGEVIDQWKQSNTTDFDISTCNRILSAFTEVGLTEKAHDLHLLLIQKNCSPTNEKSCIGV